MSDEFRRRAEREILEGTYKIMKAAQRRAALEKASRTEVGKWEVTLLGSSDRTSKELDEFVAHFLKFSKDCKRHFPKFTIRFTPL